MHLPAPNDDNTAKDVTVQSLKDFRTMHRKLEISSKSVTENETTQQQRFPLHHHQNIHNMTPFYPPDEVYRGPQRAFDVWQRDFPCVLVPATEISRSPIQEGFIYMKEFKTGSTTLASVAVRIARNQARSKLQQLDGNSNRALAPAWNMTTTNNNNHSEWTCQSRFMHLRARIFEDRNRNASFLWSVIREPTARAVSEFFHFAVSRDHVAPTLSNLKDYFHDERQLAFAKHYYVKSLSIQRGFVPRGSKQHFRRYVTSILQDYDFLGITERMDESLVVLQLLLGLNTQDLLYMPSKASGTFEWWANSQECIYITPPFVTPNMVDWFHSSEWKFYILADVMLYKAVNRSLDLTIEALGRERVERQLTRLHWAQREVYQRCANTTKFPCSADGVHHEKNDCFWMDVGCGYHCIDQVAEDLSRMENFVALPS